MLAMRPSWTASPINAEVNDLETDQAVQDVSAVLPRQYCSKISLSSLRISSPVVSVVARNVAVSSALPALVKFSGSDAGVPFTKVKGCADRWIIRPGKIERMLRKFST